METLTTEQLHDNLQKDCLALVYFTAPWCGPCKAMTPVVEKLAEEYAGRIPIYKVDIDASPDAAGRHDIRSVPQFLLFYQGNVWQGEVGMQTYTGLGRMLDEAIYALGGRPMNEWAGIAARRGKTQP